MTRSAFQTVPSVSNTTDEAQLREAADLLKEQQFYYAMDQFFEMMPSGSLAVGAYYAGDCLSVMAENPDLKFVIPECGTNFFSDAMCIPKTSTKKEMAEKFINFMLEPEVGRDNAEYLGYSSPNAAALEIMDEEIKDDPVAYPERKDSWEAFRDLPEETNALMRDLWAEILTDNK